MEFIIFCLVGDIGAFVGAYVAHLSAQPVEEEKEEVTAVTVPGRPLPRLGGAIQAMAKLSPEKAAILEEKRLRELAIAGLPWVFGSNNAATGTRKNRVLGREAIASMSNEQ